MSDFLIKYTKWQVFMHLCTHIYVYTYLTSYREEDKVHAPKWQDKKEKLSELYEITERQKERKEIVKKNTKKTTIQNFLSLQLLICT